MKRKEEVKKSNKDKRKEWKAGNKIRKGREKKRN
jgi:hypothetical protein